MGPQAGARGLASASGLLDKLLRRGLIDNVYPESQEFRAQLASMLKKPVSIYAGFDATSQSLHVGNLATIMNLLHFAQHGHRVICVIGDATTKVGDPSGHMTDRRQLDPAVIQQNASSIERLLNNLFNNHAQLLRTQNNITVEKPIVIRNSVWYKDKNVVDFVGDVFRQVRVGTLLQRKAICDRLASTTGLNMSEFSYQIFQAYDWLELRKRYDCRLQLGGSDQAGNIYTGHDLIKKITGKGDSIGLLAPLIASQSGKKLGKSTESSQSSIWLQPELTTPFKLYQFFLRTTDSDVEKFLKVFSLYEDETIEELIYNHLKAPTDVWLRQRKLAESVCRLVHGETGLNSARRLSHALYNKDPLELAKLSDSELLELFEGESIISLLHHDQLCVLDLITRSNCVSNGQDAERLVSAGAVWINGQRATSINIPITTDLIMENGTTLMRVGKRNYFLFRWGR